MSLETYLGYLLSGQKDEVFPASVIQTDNATSFQKVITDQQPFDSPLKTSLERLLIPLATEHVSETDSITSVGLVPVEADQIATTPVGLADSSAPVRLKETEQLTATALKTPVDVPQQPDETTSEFRASVWLDNGRPEWAQDAFDVLLISVGDLSLAVPLVCLGHIHAMADQTMTPIFGQANWMLGLLLTPRGQIRVVDTGLYTMPERYRHAGVIYPYVVTLAGIPWGLAVDKINQPIRLQPGDVKWRSGRVRQPWAAGVLRDKMCVLVDVPTLGKELIDSDHNSKCLA